MPKHNSIWLAGCLAMLLLPGCMEQNPTVVQESHLTELVALRQNYEKLQGENEQLKADNSVLKARVQELLRREKALTQRLNQAILDRDRTQEMVKILQDLPAERDKYKAKAHQAEKTVSQLQAQIKQLRQKLSQAEKKP